MVNGEWWHIDEVAPFPRKFLRLVGPLPFEGVEAVEIQVPVEVVAGALDAALPRCSSCDEPDA